MEHYLGYTDYPIWEVEQKGNGPVQVSTDTNRQIRVLPPKTAEEILARERERKARTTLLIVFESDIKGSTASSSSTQNVAFVSSESTNSTNDVSTAYGVSTSSGYNSQKEGSSSYTDELKYSFFANQSSVAMISMRLKKFYKKTRRRLQFDAKEPVGFDKTKVECFNCHNTWHFARECRSKGNQESRRRDAGNTGYKAKDNGRRPGKQEEPKALVTLDGDGVDWTGHAEDEQENFALMAYSNSGSNTENRKFKPILKLQQGRSLNWFVINISTYYEEKIRFMKIDLDDKTNVLTYHKKLLAEAVKEKEELKTKLENFQSSSKGLSVLSYEKEVLESVFDSRSSDVEDSPVNDRFAKVEGMHAVPPPMTGIYMPSKSDFGIDESKFTYGPKQSKTSESDAKTSDTASCESNSSVETSDSVPKPAVNEPTNSMDVPALTGNKAYLVEYQDYNGGPVAFGGGLACLIAKATIDESNKWHRRLGHVNFKNLNKLVKGNLVRGLPSKIFQNDHTCVACQKGKQHKASCKAKSVSSISHSLQLLHMDLFGPTSVRSLNHKTYCLVITDDFSRFSWVFFLRTKDETSGILKDFIRQIENQLNQKVKTIRCDNGTEFKNRDFIELCGSKGIKREYSNARTPQQNRVAERKNRTLIEAARTMLADSFLPNTFWAEVVSTACYVLNRVLVTKPQNKTLYELITGKIPIISYIRPFGCHVTILNTVDHLGKFDGKSDKGFLVGYSLNSKAFRPVRSENQANKHAGPKEANHNTGTQDNIDAGNYEIEAESAQDYFVLPIWSSCTSTVKSSIAKNEGEKSTKNTDLKTNEKLDLLLQAGAARASSTNTVNTASTPISIASPSMADFTNLETIMNVSPIPTSRIYTIHPKTQILRDPTSAVLTRSKVNKSFRAHALISEALQEESWAEAMQEELLKFKLQKVWILVDLPNGKRAIGTKWVYRNKKDERGVVVRNKERLVALGYRQEEGIDYDEVFAPVARIKSIRIFLAFVSYMGFIVYQMDVKSAFLYGTIDKAWYATLSTFLEQSGYRRGTIGKTLFIKKDKNDIIVKTASTPIESQKPLVKDEEASDVNVYLYRSMIGSLMYLTASRPDIMFAVCACSRFQVTPKTSHLNVVKRIFRKSTTDEVVNFFGRRLISCNAEQTIVATSTTEAEYVAAANCCRQVLWIQNQMLDYGFNFMNIKIHIDNESTICIVKNPVFHSKTKHIEIRNHFIRDAYEKKLIQVSKIHADYNVADLLTKAFDISRFKFLVVNIGMINQ
ncbi:retrovirus-related pol polyprotein from transposon TNT 1-94 [Tanacetum coccineum]|uniref:Retrovirus-related pol polyprotein from transposon TNT 1-94 n=1 Tax=Tanacetum coccineum TaxID=301880 RepID=A0ABQ4YUB2_9ASTR